MVTPATPDTADSIGATTDDSKGGLFTSGSSTALVTIQGVISELVTDAQTIETNVEAIETRINDFGLAGLTDVTVTSISDNELLQYDSGTSKWINQTLAEAGAITASSSDTLTNKTLTSPVFNTGVSGSAVLDSDTMSGASATTLATSESIKAYVDSRPGDISEVIAGTGMTGGGASGAVTLNVIAGTGITANADDIAVNASQTQITALGTIGTGTWQGTAIADTYLATISTAGKVALGALEIDGGTDVGADLLDADLIIIDDGAGGANRKSTLTRTKKYIYSAISSDATASDAGVITLADGDSTRTNLGLAIGSDVQAYDADLAALGGLAKTDSNFIVGNGSTWVAETGATVRTSLGLGGTTITVSDGSSSTATALGGTITFAGTTNEVEVGESSGTITVGLPDNVTIGGNLTVSGTTTTVNTATLSVEDPLIKLANNNSGSDAVDIGFYGLYDTSGSQDLYAGLFRDANDSGKFKLFKDLQAEPDTTVNTSGTGYATGTLVASLEGNVTGNVSGTAATVTGAAQSSITSLGTLTTLSVDNITINGNDISSTAGTDLTITPLSGQQIVLDGTIVVDAGVVTGATSITSDVFVGPLTGNVTGNTSGSSGSTTGNAATATALASAVNIGGVSFNGTGNIDLPGVNTAGNQNTSGTAALATAVTATANNTADETVYPTFVDGATGTQGIETDTGLNYNPSTGVLTSTTFTGNLTGDVTGNVSGSSGSSTGNAATATALASARTIGGTSFDGTGNIAVALASVGTAVTVADESSDTTCFPLFTTAATGDLPPKSGSNLTFNSSSGLLTATLLAGDLTGDVTGNADTATTVSDNAITLAKMAGLARGKLITGDASGDPSAFALGSNGEYLKSDGDDLVWGAATISGLAADDITIGDAAVSIATTSGNITIDAQANDADVIIKVDDAGSSVTAVTFDGSDAGTATFNSGINTGGNVTITSTDAGSGVAPDLTLYRNSSSPADSDDLAQIKFTGRNDNSQDVDYAAIQGGTIDVSDGTEDGKLHIAVMTNGTLSNRITLRGTASTKLLAKDVELTNGDLFFSTAGKGIVLGATSNLDANTLDDYEEGTHTVTMTCATSGSITMNGSYNTMAYVKIGNLVTVSGDLRVSSVSSPVGAIAMSLPFTVSSSRFVNAILTHGIAKQSNQLGGFILQTNSGAATTAISYNKDNATNASLSGTIAASNEFKVTLTYQV